MPLYLSRFSYTPQTWARLIGDPEDRRKAAQSYIESVGGKLHGFWYAFGTHDGYNLWEAPDNVSMAAVALAISGGGALSSLETTVLLTVEETMDALRRAEQVQYQAPGAWYRTCSALRRASSVSSTVRRTVVSSELSAPPPLIASATAAIDTLSGASHRV